MNKTLSFSTRTIANDSRISALGHNLKHILPDMNVSQSDRQELTAEIHSIHLDSMTVARLDFSAISLIREPRHLRDNDDAFSIVCCQSGSYEVIRPSGDGLKVFPGMASLISHRQASNTYAHEDNGSITLVLPRDVISLVLRDPDKAAEGIPKGGLAALGLLTGYISSVLSQKRLLSVTAVRMVEGHFLDLIANTFDPEGQWCRTDPNDGIKSAHTRQLLSLIAKNYAQPNASAKTFALQLGHSTRIIHQLLEETGKTFCEHILEHRLQAAKHALQSPRNAHLRILDIALKVGFSDISYFNRMFRRRFGGTPGSYR